MRVKSGLEPRAWGMGGARPLSFYYLVFATKERDKLGVYTSWYSLIISLLRYTLQLLREAGGGPGNTSGSLVN